MALALIFTLFLSVSASGLEKVGSIKEGSNNSITEQSSFVKIECSELLHDLKNEGQKLIPPNLTYLHALIRLAASGCTQNSNLVKEVGLILALVVAIVVSVVLATLLWRKRREDRTMEVELQVISITCLCPLSYLFLSYLIISYLILSYTGTRVAGNTFVRTTRGVLKRQHSRTLKMLQKLESHCFVVVNISYDQYLTCH